MQDHPKHVKKQLRELSEKAYKRELDAALSDLHKQFETWRQDKIDCWDLNDSTHEFHDGISRELYKQYTMSGNSSHGFLVASALARKVLCREEISDDVYNIIEPIASLINHDPF